MPKMESKTLNQINHSSLTDRVYKVLKEKIVRQELESGTRLVEKEMADQLGISRAPVREAIGQLKAEGLVVVSPRRGVFVVDLSSKDIKGLYEVREALESLAVKLSMSVLTDEHITQLRRIVKEYDVAMNGGNYVLCFDLDKEFHTYLVMISDNKKLIDVLANLEGSIQVTRWINCKRTERKEISVREHKKIVNALAKRDAGLACKLIAEHIKRVKKDLLRQ